ncbi:MAG: cadherin-like domain-containing protein [Planctomycetaceae bacterium]
MTYTPDAGFVGADSFTYTISDGNGGTATGNVAVEVSAASEWTDLAFEDFENGFGSYTDGGRDASLYTGGTRAHQGSNAVQLQDNSGTASSITLTDSLDLATPGYSRLKIEFWFQSVSFEAGEELLVQFFDGSVWQTVSVLAAGADFQNNEFSFASIELMSQDYTFSSNTKIRLMANASGKDDKVYIDEIRISAR